MAENHGTRGPSVILLVFSAKKTAESWRVRAGIFEAGITSF